MSSFEWRRGPSGLLLSTASMTDAEYAGRVDRSTDVRAALVKAASFQAHSPLAVPRRVVGQDKAITAEGWYAVKTYTKEDLVKELKRR